MNIFQLGLSFSGFSIPLIGELCMLIDWGIYSIAYAALQGFYDILKVSYMMFGASEESGFYIIKALIQRVMVLGGIYALFRVSLILINYIINPDKLKEAQKTGLDIAKNAFIAIILLLSSSFIFEKLGEFQQLVFESNVIERLIYGTDEETEIKNTAKKFTNNMWLLFFTRKSGTEGKGVECTLDYNNVQQGTGEIITLIGCNYLYYDYFIVAPTIVGILLIYYFVMYSMELASRMLKLLTLEVLSPIAIIMSVDPASKNKLTNFAKTYMVVYLQVFLRVLTFYLAFALCSLVINNTEIFMGESASSGALLFELNWFLKVIVIIGIFQGAKSLPVLIQEALGLKITVGDTAKTFGGYVRGLFGAGTGLVGGTVAGAISGGVSGAIAGGARGIVGGTAAGLTSKNWGQNISSQIANIGKSGTLGKTVKSAGGLFPFMGAGISNAFGGYSRDQKRISSYDKDIESINKSMSDINKAAELRNNLSQTVGTEFDNKFGSLQERLGKDEILGRIQFTQQQKPVQTYEDKLAVDEAISRRTKEIEDNYNSEKDAYFRSQISLASSGEAKLDADTLNIKRSLETYNSFIDDKNLSDRKVTNYSDFEKLRNIDNKDLTNYERQVRQSERAKKKYESSPEVKSRKEVHDYSGKGKKSR